MKKSADILDRDREWARLVELWKADSAQLVVMVGRRRVGKSWILQRFAGAAGGIYFQATRGTRSEQIGRLTRVAGDFFDDPALKQGTALTGWEGFFEYVTEKAGEKPFLLVLDEFPYLADEDPGLTSIIQSMWDQRWKDSGTFKLVLCGSHITFMQQLEGRDQPLHGRRTARLRIAPFTYREMSAIVPDYDRRDQLLTYGIFGGLPGHLDAIDPGRSLGENVAALILDPSSRLHDEAMHVLDSFGREADVPYSTLFAIAMGAHTWGEIKNRVDRSEGALWPVIEWLQEMEMASRDVPVTRDQPSKSKVSLYRLTDPYLRFWYRFIQPLYSSGSAGLAEPLDLWKRTIEPGLDDYMGAVFEDICRDSVRTGLTLPLKPLRVGRWWTRDGRHEVDIVVRGVEDELFVGECKWGGVSGADLQTLRERGRMAADELGRVSRIFHGLFSAADRKDDAVSRAEDDGEVLYFGPEALFD